MGSKNDIKNYFTNFNKIYSFNNFDILYDEESFGNIHVKLTDKDGVILSFVKDRGQVWGEIGTQKEMFLLEDVLEALELNFNLETNDFLNLVDKFLLFYMEEHSKFLKAFSPLKLRHTHSKIKKIEKRRSKNLYNN